MAEHDTAAYARHHVPAGTNSHPRHRDADHFFDAVHIGLRVRGQLFELAAMSDALLPAGQAWAQQRNVSPKLEHKAALRTPRTLVHHLNLGQVSQRCGHHARREKLAVDLVRDACARTTL